MTSRKWTSQELEILKTIVYEPGKLIDKIDRLPGWSYDQIKARALWHGFRRAPVIDQVLEVLSDGVARNTKEICAATGRTREAVNAFFREFSEEGEDQMVHVVSGAIGRIGRYWAIGPGKNAEDVIGQFSKPVPKVEEVPPYLAVIINSMNAMVQAGRARQ